MAVALPVTVGSAVLLLLASERGKIKGDAAIAMLSAGALSVGYLLLNLFPSANTGKFSEETLFGSTSMLTLTGVDVLLCVLLAAFIYWHISSKVELPAGETGGISQSIVQKAPETIPEFSRDDFITWGDRRDSNSRVLEPQSSVLTSFTTTAICLDIIAYLKIFVK